mmetsp:Transcript_72774/g.115153  ORF Transcript_72774/g.115153 Transcript_72774/m.115153 type:complete len:149 (-) Transcript_72774:205-651(-)
MGLERALGHLVFWVWVGVREADSSAAAGDVSENRCVLGESETQVASTPGTALLQQNFARRAPHLSETLREELQESEREGDIAIVALQDSAHRKASKTDHGLIISFFQWLNKSMQRWISPAPPSEIQDYHVKPSRGVATVHLEGAARGD